MCRNAASLATPLSSWSVGVALGRGLPKFVVASCVHLTDEEALAAADALLDLVPQLPEKPDGFGLVEQQRPFALLRSE